MLEYRQLGNTAMKPQVEYEPEYEPQQKTQKHTPVKKKKLEGTKEVPLPIKIKIISRVLLVTALALLMVARFAAVSIANIGLEEAKKTVKEQQVKNTDLESILAGSMQLDTIQEKAMALGMSFPSSDQMVYINLVPYSDLVSKNNANIKQNKKSILSQVID